ALDIVWSHSELFSKVGVFSGALWWRQKALDAGYEENDRIMHARIRNQVHKPGLQFWFQCGTNDETDDRDFDGVIDSIQDTLECIAELEKKGYDWHTDVRYIEVKGGEHNVPTWAAVMPEFLIWAFPKKRIAMPSSIW
ncbi:MAG TPA: alpha/beta hydrolase-fold protein, partial [Dyadobacter sp.]|nr:alpha/beta hydrolase-fold protein [Dyadobacter sp.]